MANERVFVTGGSGFVGRNLIRRLVAEGHPVRALARSQASAGLVSALGAEPWMGDILDPVALERGMVGCDWLVHAAADTGHGALEAGQHHTNLAGTTNVFTAAREAGVRRAVHVSTEAVLLTGTPLRNATEAMAIPTRHAGSYSASKAAAERTALALDSKDCTIVAVRPRFVWGRDDSTALPQLAAAAREGRLVWIGGGDYLTSTTHIDNAVEGVMLALAKGRGGEAYFITDGPPVQFRSFVSQLLERAGVAPPMKSVPRWLVASLARLGDWLSRLTGGRLRAPIGMQEYGTVGVEVTLDTSKAERELGYRPVIDRAAGLATVGKV